MEIKSKEIVLVDIDSLVPCPKKLIEILKNSKNMLKFFDTFVEMQVFDKEGNEFFVKIDYEKIEKLSQIKWRAQRNTETYVSIVATHEKTTITQSRVILGISNELLCDHKNGDPTDNRLENLRIATHSQNMMNRKTLKKGSKYKGIYFCKIRKNWVAQISIDGKTKNIGRFFTDKQAAIAYNEQAKIHYGDFAKLNEINND